MAKGGQMSFTINDPGSRAGGTVPRRPRTFIQFLLSSALLLGCDGAPIEPTIAQQSLSVFDFGAGVIEVTTVTTGPAGEIDPDGYRVRLDGRHHQHIDVNGSVTFQPVAPGSHQVDLKEVWGHCRVPDGNVRNVVVAAGGTARVLFEVECGDPEPDVGSVAVYTTTTGDMVDPDGYRVRLDGKEYQDIELNGLVTFNEVPVGPHQVDLKEVWGHCTVTSDNPQAVTIVAGETAAVTFAVVCEASTEPEVGTLQVTTVTTGPEAAWDPDGYIVRVDEAGGMAVGVNETLTYGDVAAGAHSVDLMNVAGTCTVTSDNPQAVTIVAGETTTVTFTVSCSVPIPVAPAEGAPRLTWAIREGEPSRALMG